MSSHYIPEGVCLGVVLGAGNVMCFLDPIEAAGEGGASCCEFSDARRLFTGVERISSANIGLHKYQNQLVVSNSSNYYTQHFIHN